MTEKRMGGRLSFMEKKYIQTVAEKLSYAQIAEELGRNPKTVKNYIEDELGRKIIKTGGSTHEVGYDIKKSLIWKELEKQFSEDELKTFVWLWNRVVAQFKEDVFPTEELQIVDMIKIEILLNRVLEQKRKSDTVIAQFEVEKANEEKKSNEEQDLKKILNLEKLIAFHVSATQNSLREYNNLLDKKSLMLKELKGTRAERIKRIEDSRESFSGWLAEILRNTQLRKELGIVMEKMRVATEVETVRLMQEHKYMDDVIDYPLLNSNTIEYIEKREQLKDNNE